MRNNLIPFDDISGIKGQVVGIGTDICQISRIAALYRRFGEHFLKRVYAPQEQALFHTVPHAQQMAFLAKRFAAKEACVKALGTGFGQYAFMQEICVISSATGQPEIMLSGITLANCQKKINNHIPQWHLSLSDDQDYALAFCVFSAIS